MTCQSMKLITTYVSIQPSLAAELLKQLLGRQSPPRVPYHRHHLGAEVAVCKSHGEVSGVIIHELDQCGHTGGAGVGLLDIDAT